ncbi:GIY-YIG nuclease family protein [Streptomyces salinarius]|uniref:GIY-YIG nuclease family protein n=1 Tax=Streptomyces salinarius TaxID=2762598 RepID=UPI0028525127|nr:GIY-YIG nuclease family protein [Streptomyces salinarius]
MSVANTAAGERAAGVYRLWDAEGHLLYIGASYDPERRLQGHRDKPWWLAVARSAVEWHETRAAAYRAELDAIVAEGPLHNAYGTGRQTTGLRSRAEGNRARGAVQREAYRFEREVYDDALQAGRTHREAYREGQTALAEHLDASCLFPAWVERLRAEHGLS